MAEKKKDIFAQLSEPFPPAEIEWRVGSTNGDKTKGLALAYITARHVMDRLDAVVGPANWQDKYEVIDKRTICSLSLRIDGEWITKSDGAGDSDVEAEKGSISDALKRAAVKWGIGRYLYDLGNLWVETEPAGRSVKIKQGEYRRLEAALAKQFGKPAEPPKQAQAAPETPFDGEPDPAAFRDERDEIKILIDGIETVKELENLFRTERVKKFRKEAPEPMWKNLVGHAAARKAVIISAEKEAA